MSRRAGFSSSFLSSVRGIACGALLVAMVGCNLEQPFQGPGFADGALTTDAPGPFLASTTLLVLAPDPAAKPAFDKHMAVLGEQIKSQEGLVGYSLGLLIGGNGYRTLSVWESEEAMLGWVVSDAHAAAMDEMADLAEPESAVTSWSITREELEEGPPDWQEARERLDRDGRNVY